ncbi:radical SAM protein [Patescibacteria group bacterium]|nr:radical SAM protein [Patescibacteria group bacterium]
MKSFYGQEPNQFRELGDSQLQCFDLEIVPGRKCQLDCEACYKRNGETTAGDTSLADALDYIGQAQSVGFKEVALLGGEPTLHPDICEITRHIRELSLNPIIATNGIKLANEDFARRLLEKIQAVVVTHAYFPGGEEVIDSYSGKNGYSYQLKQAIVNVTKIDATTVVLEMPLVDSLFPHALNFFRYCRESGVVPFIEISRRRDNGNPTTAISPEQIAELFEQFREYDRQNGFEPPIAIHPPAYGIACTMPITGVHVKNHGGGDYGGVYSCCAQSIRHGDLKEQSLAEIMQSPTLTVYRDQDRYIVGPCKECDIYDECKGGCRGEAVLQFGCPRASNPNCHHISKEIRNIPEMMAPGSCEGCPAEECNDCSLTHLKTDAK